MDNFYGYRPNKSGHQAVREVQKNVQKYSWVIDLDIKEFFENINHELLFKALEVHVCESWVKMYIKRWLEAPIQLKDGTLKHATGRGTPQGGVISALLFNLFLHYCTDRWLVLHFPKIKRVRFADDMIIHCSKQGEARYLLAKVTERLKQCGLSVHPQKTKIVYCKKAGRGLKDYQCNLIFEALASVL